MLSMLGLIFDKIRDTCLNLRMKHLSIWDENSKQFIDCDLLYSKLIDRRNCISEYSKIKKCIPKDYLKFLKNENNEIDNKMLGLIFDKIRDTCLNLRMKHLSICK
jgi:hypothetical protein